MCEVLIVLIASLGEILKSAISIALGTTLATVVMWILLIGPILRDNDRRKRDEEIIAEASKLVRAIDSSFDNIQQQQMLKRWAQEMIDKVNELSKHVKQTVKATIPELADALDTSVNQVVTRTTPLNAFLRAEVDDNRVAEWVSDSVTEIEMLRTDCEDLIRTLDARKRENIQRLVPQEILDRFKEVRDRLC